jgi:hypothetical protein
MIKKLSALAKQETIEQVKKQVTKAGSEAENIPVDTVVSSEDEALDSGLTAIDQTIEAVEHTSALASDKTAGAMKDLYIELLEKGYKPQDVQKYMKDITVKDKDPAKVPEPKPKMSALHRDQEQEVDDISEEIEKEL